MTDRKEPRWRILARSDFEQTKKRAKELLKSLKAGDPDAITLLTEFHPSPPKPAESKLADAQLTIARAHDYSSWPRFKRAVALFNAIAADDPEETLRLIRAHPETLHERVNGESSNWGPPLATAANIGAARVVAALLDIPGQDLQWAIGRAILHGRNDMARALIAKGARVAPGEVMGPCETLNVEGLRFLASVGAPLTDEHGDPMAPIGMLLQGYLRDPAGKHACLGFFAEHGINYPDTLAMAFHLGRVDLLERRLARDPTLVHRRFSHREIYPLELGCHEDESLALHGAPLAGTTLLHMAADFDEIEIARWLLEKGADPNARALVDADGFGGHTPLFNIVVSQAWRSRRQRDGAFARLLLEAGADPNARASIRKGIRFTPDESVHEYRDVTPIAFGRAFHLKEWVSDVAMALIAERGGG